MADLVHLGIESIGKTGSLAVMKGDEVLWQRRLPQDRRTASEMSVHLEQALSWCEAQQVQMGWIAVANGPGSFTGIRIGVTTAKCLAYGLSVPVVAVGSLAAIACAVSEPERPPGDSATTPTEILVGLNAYRGQVFAATFRQAELVGVADGVSFRDVVDRAEVITREKWSDQLRQWTASDHSNDRIATGDAILFQDNPSNLTERHDCDAVGVGRLAARLVAGAKDRSVFQDALHLSANYLKQSAAEEKASTR